MVSEAYMNVQAQERFGIGKALINDMSGSDRPKYANSCWELELLAVEDSGNDIIGEHAFGAGIML
jgi:hypothetical protein